MRRLRGFTLIELMIVMAVVILLTGLSVAYGGEYISRRQAEGAAFQVVQDLREVQSESIFKRQFTRIRFAPSANTYTIYNGDGSVRMTRNLNNAAGFPLAVLGGSYAGTSVFLTSAQSCPPQVTVDLYFSPFGRPCIDTTGLGSSVDTTGAKITIVSRAGHRIDVTVSTALGSVAMKWQ
jgi:prepilin-type N-terminal cleavage/methylation domain-containing protein